MSWSPMNIIMTVVEILRKKSWVFRLNTVGPLVVFFVYMILYASRTRGAVPLTEILFISLIMGIGSVSWFSIIGYMMDKSRMAQRQHNINMPPIEKHTTSEMAVQEDHNMEERKLTTFDPQTVLSVVKALARENIIRGAVGSLMLWGAINLAAWYFLGTENRNFLEGLPNPSTEINILIYGTAVMGAAMLSLGFVGVLTKLPIFIILDGFALISVGVWNIGHDFLADFAIRPYGYKLQEFSRFWPFLGAGQLLWGFHQFKRFWKTITFLRVSKKSTVRCNATEFVLIKQSIAQFVKKPEDIENGILKASITVESYPSQKTTNYTGQLYNEIAIFISEDMDDCFCIEKKDVASITFGDDLPKTFSDKMGYSFNTLSASTIKHWGGGQDSPSVIKNQSDTGQQDDYKNSWGYKLGKAYVRYFKHR